MVDQDQARSCRLSSRGFRRNGRPGPSEGSLRRKFRLEPCGACHQRSSRLEPSGGCRRRSFRLVLFVVLRVHFAPQRRQGSQVPPPPSPRIVLSCSCPVPLSAEAGPSAPQRQLVTAAKAGGTVLGAHGKVLADQRKVEALDRLVPLADRLRAMRHEGLTMRAIADRLNAEGVVSPAGGVWQARNVHRPLARLGG